MLFFKKESADLKLNLIGIQLPNGDSAEVQIYAKGEAYAADVTTSEAQIAIRSSGWQSRLALGALRRAIRFYATRALKEAYEQRAEAA